MIYNFIFQRTQIEAFITANNLYKDDYDFPMSI